MKRFLILLLLGCSLTAFGQNGLVMPSLDPEADSLSIAQVRARMDSIRQYRPTVAVVLGGGGAREGRFNGGPPGTGMCKRVKLVVN